jgi:hypothetical protein
MIEVPFDNLIKGNTYYIQSNTSINPDVDKTSKKIGKFLDYHTFMYDGDDVTIAEFTNLKDIKKPSGTSFPITAFTDESLFFLPQKDSLMLGSIINQRTNSDIGTTISKMTNYGGSKKRRNKSSKTRRNKASKNKKKNIK